MKIITLTMTNNIKVNINISHIGHFFKDYEKLSVVAITTHNNGGIEVLETPEEIIKKIEELTHTKI